MAVAQDTFNQYRDNAYEGQVSDIGQNDIVSRVIETAAIGFGKPVVNGSGSRSVVGVSGSTVAGDIKGFSVRSMAVENNASDVAEYGVGDVASVLRRGRIFVKCVDGATKDDSVFVVINVAGGDALGDLRGSADSTNTIQLTNVKWIDDVAAGAIGEIQADGILA